jgi:hypothetical protein
MQAAPARWLGAWAVGPRSRGDRPHVKGQVARPLRERCALSHRPHTVVSSFAAHAESAGPGPRSPQAPGPVRQREKEANMERDNEIPMRRTRLPADDPFSGARPEAARRAGARGVRWASNWTAAALIAATAATAGYFAHAAHVAPAAPVTGTVRSGSAPGPASAHRPVVSNPVVTSGGSGVVVRTTPGTGGGTGRTGGTVIVYRDN